MVDINQAIENVKSYEVQLNLDYSFKDDLRERIISSVKEDVEDERINIALSGGLDSSLILSLAKDMTDKEINAYTITDNKKSQEVRFSKEICDRYNTKHHIILINNSKKLGIGNIYEDFLKGYEIKQKEKAIGGGEVALLLYKELADNNVDKIITGDGADELFGGYWMHEFPLGFKEFAPMPIDEKESLLLKEMLESNTGVSKEENRLAALKYFWNRLTPDQLVEMKEISKHFEIDIRLPYLNESVINLANKIPLKKKVGKGYRKKILKNIARDYLPEKIINRKKKGLPDAVDLSCCN
ncbi:MAG: asparagine synthase [Candidatus Aenigmarchaeota archaeon]|nr:asparagine synthase [Candidatus Aenigmarchaeota archaeon]